MAYIRYPSEFSSDNPATDYVKFTSVRRDYGGQWQSSTTTAGASLHRDEPQNGTDGVVLYMPQRLFEANSQRYKHTELGPEVSSALTGGPVGTGPNALDFGDIAIRLLENKSIDYASKALATLGGVSLGANSILSATSGVIYNPMMEVLYDGPQFRTFNYQFMLFAKSESDAENIYKIVRFFQMCSVPSLNGEVQKSGLSSVLGTATSINFITGITGTITDTAKDTLNTKINDQIKSQGGNQQQGGGGNPLATGFQGALNTLFSTAGGLAGSAAALTGLTFGGNQRFINQPPQLRVEYKRGADAHPYIKSPEICLIENIQVDYTPSGNYTVLNNFGETEKATVVATLVTLTLTETKIIYQDYYT